MRLIFGPLEPDKPEHLQQGLQIADNVYPSPNGYRPIKSFDAMTDALPHTFQGGMSFTASDGTVQMLAGTATDLYRFDNTLSWSSIIGSLTANRWYFTQFNDHAIATMGGTPVDINLLTGTAAALAGTPPDANFCATVREFVVTAKDSLVSWSGFEDRTEWSGLNQSGNKPMLDGGPVTGLAGGEYGLVFQRSQITRMSYAGPPTVWQWDAISANVGCSAAGSIAQAGRLVFFLSDRGFQMTDGNDVIPIGAELVDRTFLEAYTRQDIDDFMYAAVDPLNTIVKWVMPGKAWIYNWLQKSWATETWDIRAAFTGYTAGLTLEDLDAIYPDMDAMTPSLDDPAFVGGVPLFLAVNASNEIGTMQGGALKARWQLPHMELSQGRETRINQIRPLTDCVSGMIVTVTGRQRLGDTGLTHTFATLEDSGDIDCRISGRYLRFDISIDANSTWTYNQGLDVNAMAAGGRR